MSSLRELRRHPRALVAVLVLSLAVGLLSSFRVGSSGLESRRYEVGYARAAALVDTQPSQSVDAQAGGGSITALTDSAVLLADLMTRSPLRDEIADRAGIPPDELLSQRPMNLLEKRLTLPEVRHATVQEDDSHATLLYVGVHPLAEGESPIIGVDVRAPDPETAARVADQAIAALSERVDSPADAQNPLAVHQLEPASAGTTIVGPSRTLAVLAMIGVFGMGCAAMIGTARLRAGLRRRRFTLE